MTWPFLDMSHLSIPVLPIPLRASYSRLYNYTPVLPTFEDVCQLYPATPYDVYQPKPDQRLLAFS
ncbi:hypothetical protein EMCRGX_G016620 [Ephydatia muelleri]